MKFNFRKVASVIASVVMLGSTIGIAAAANYPAPFVQGGAANVGVVVGASAAYSDWSASLDLAQNLQYELAKQTATSGTSSGSSVSGEAASLNSGTNLLYLGQTLSTNVQTVTKSDMPNTLADGTFTDDDGNDYNYEQVIKLGGDAGNTLAFSSAGSNLNDPTMLLALESDTAKPAYNLTVTFDKAVNFTTAASEGQSITLFGKTFTVGTDTDSTKLVLLGGADSKTINVGESATFTVGTETHTVMLTGLSTSDTATKAALTVDGVAATMTQSQTKKVNGVDVFVKTVFKTGDNAGYVEVQLGSNKLTFESGQQVMKGSNDDSIDGTLVYLDSVGAMTKMIISVAAADSDTDYLLTGTSYVDPVFGAVKLNFAGAPNGPVITGHDDTSIARSKIAVNIAGDRTLTITMTDKNGVVKTIPFTFDDVLADKSNNTVAAIEGASIVKNGYTIVDSGDYSALWQVTGLSLHAGTATDDITIKDVFSGENVVSLTNENLTAGKEVTIAGQTFTITKVAGSTTAVTIVSSDYSLTSGSGTVQVFPYLDLVSGMDQKLALAQIVTVGNVKSGTKFALPDGTETFTMTNYSGPNGPSITSTAGTIKWNETVVAAAATQNTTGNLTFSVNKTLVPSIVFVEEEDKAEATANTENAVILTEDNSTADYSSVGTPSFTATNTDDSVFDDSDFHGYIDTFGTFVMTDSSDTHQNVAWLTYPKNQMYADVYIASAGATVTPGVATGGSVSALGSVTVSDAEYSKVNSKNVIVVGGSCINSVAASLLGSAYCGAGFTSATGVASGQYLIQSFANANAAGKVALVVAGYEAADTVNAVTYLTTQSPDTTIGKKYVGTTATSATSVTATSAATNSTA